jgi:hypothetical protein
MTHLPVYIAVTFILTTIITVFIFYKATRKSTITIVVLLILLVVQSLIGLSGFYTTTDTVPPRFLLLIGPPLFLIIILFLTNWGKAYLDSLDLKTLTILHIIRVPVEIVLLWLFIHKAIPELMTFEGRNFDILSGLTSPLIYYFGFVRKNLSNAAILAWNFICLGLLINIVANAILSVPTTFQKFAFDQPNVGILYFPFNLLPACVVPLVLLSHLAAIRQLLDKIKNRR